MYFIASSEDRYSKSCSLVYLISRCIYQSNTVTVDVNVAFPGHTHLILVFNISKTFKWFKLYPINAQRAI